MTQDVTLTELIDKLSELFTNMNNLDKTYYNMFYNQTPMDITLERYDENGVLTTVTVPNRAKDKDYLILGEGEPANNVSSYAGKMYMDMETGYLYYKSTGTQQAPTLTGWLEIYTQQNAADTFVMADEKGVAGGVATLGEDGKITPSQLPATSISYYDLGETIVLDLILQTILQITCSNSSLVFSNNYHGTDEALGTRTEVLTQDTDSTYAINTDVVTVSGSPVFSSLTGKMSNFSNSNYLTVAVDNAVIKFNTGADFTTQQTIASFDGHDILFTPSNTTVEVTCTNPDLGVASTYTGTEDTPGTYTDTITFSSKVGWNYTTCPIQGNLDFTTGMVGNFTTSNYLTPSISWTSVNTLFVEFATGEDITTPQVLVGTNMSVAIKDGYLGYNTQNDLFIPVQPVQANTTYYLRLAYDSENATNIVRYSLDNETYTQITPEGADTAFILNSYALGKGSLEGENNVVFLGTINGLNSAIITPSLTTSTFASIITGWFVNDIQVTLQDYDLEITSGLPELGDVITATYTTTAPSIGTQAVTVNSDYYIRYYYDDSTHVYTPQISTDNSTYVAIGTGFMSDEFYMTVGKGVFNGIVDMYNSAAEKISLSPTRSYTAVGSITDENGYVNGFSASNYVTVNRAITGNSQVFCFVLGSDVVNKQVLLSSPALTVTGANAYNTLYLENGGIFVSIEGVDTATNLTGLTADDVIYIRYTHEEGDYTMAFSTDNIDYTALDMDGATDFSGLFTSNVVTVGTDFTSSFAGTFNAGNSYDLAGDIKVKMYRMAQTVLIPATSLATLTVTYNWYNNGELVSLADYGVTLVSGTPETGDILTLTYVTTPVGVASMSGSGTSGSGVVEATVTTLPSQGTIELLDNTINSIKPTGNVTFVLPEVVNRDKFHEILVQVTLTSAYTIDLGLGATPHWLTETEPNLSGVGNYELIYQYDKANGYWEAGVLVNGEAS